VFWWYFAEDMPADPTLAGALGRISDDITGRTSVLAAHP
jgi:hypothetical protein